MPERGPLNEVDARFTEDRAVWKHWHCDEVFNDEEETAEKQKDPILHFKADGDRHFAEDGRLAEVTIDMVLQARSRVAKEKVSGPEDSHIQACQLYQAIWQPVAKRVERDTLEEGRHRRSRGLEMNRKRAGSCTDPDPDEPKQNARRRDDEGDVVCTVLGEDTATADEDMDMATWHCDEHYGDQLSLADVEVGRGGDETR